MECHCLKSKICIGDVKTVRDATRKLVVDQDMLRRAVSVGLCGGEKKRNELLQTALLEQRLALLDCRCHLRCI